MPQIQATLIIAGRRVRFLGTQEACRTIYLSLPHHQIESGYVGHLDGPDIQITLQPDESKERDWRSVTFSDDGLRWEVCYGATALTNVPTRFYYRVILPTLKEMFAKIDIVCFHSAYIKLRNRTKILLIGNSGAGKTTTTASCAIAGGSFLSDDIIMWSAAQKTWYGLRRPMNIHPNTIRWLSSLSGIQEAQPYHPGRAKLAYDWWSFNSDRWLHNSKGLDMIMKSRIAPHGESTLIQQLPNQTGYQLLFESLEVSSPSALELCREAAADALVYEVSWAEDAWLTPDGPAQLLEVFSTTAVTKAHARELP